MKKSFWNRRIPTLFGIVLIIIGIGVTSILVKQNTFFITKATPTDVPQNVEISDITDTSFSVSYTTDDSVLGSVIYGKTTNLGAIMVDQKDKNSKEVSTHNTHIFSLEKLTPQTKYFFYIVSGQKTYLNAGKLYEVTTGPTILESRPPDIKINGTVIAPDATQIKEGLVFAQNEEAETFSTTIENGKYTLHVNTMRTHDLLSYLNFNDDTKLNLLITNGTFKSNIVFLPKKTQNLPPITLSKDYDFTTETPSTMSSSLTIAPIFSTVNKTPVRGVNLQVLSPKKDQGLNDGQPTFSGTAQPNSSVKIIIHSDPITAQVATDPNGFWIFRPQTPLPPGTHTISISSRDASGILKTVSQNFVVFASGSQVIESATPSSTITPTAIVTSSPTPTTIITPIPTSVLTPVLTPTPTLPTPSPTAIILPVTGDTSIVIAGAVGVTTTLMGFLILLLARGGPM